MRISSLNKNSCVIDLRKIDLKNFKQLRVWKKGVEIAVKCLQLTDTFPSKEKFNLSQQITSAAISIPSNIAEGSSRTSNKDYCRFLEIALCSSFELETQLFISECVNYGDSLLRTNILVENDHEQKMIIGFISKLKS